MINSVTDSKKIKGEKASGDVAAHAIQYGGGAGSFVGQCWDGNRKGLDSGGVLPL